MAFYAVYIEEAHPSDLWQMGVNVREGVVFASPRTDSERANWRAVACATWESDSRRWWMESANTVEKMYTGWPDRLVLIGADGRVLYISGAGPFGFRPAELERAIAAAVPAVVRSYGLRCGDRPFAGDIRSILRLPGGT